MSGQTAASQLETTRGGTRSAEVVRLLRAPLGPSFLGERVQMDFYARNGFRFLAVPAWLDRASLALRCQQFRNIVRLDATRARRLAIHTIGDEHLDSGTLLSVVARLESPRHRFFAELFWPHVPENEFSGLREAGKLGSAKLIQAFANGGGTGVERAHHVHLRALAHHCIAIELELDFLEKRSAVPEGHWEGAMEAWRELWGLNEFWDYMRGRVEKMDDPRLQREDADKAREELPRLILGPHELLAEKYAGVGNYHECVRHLNLITQSGFPDEIVRAAAWNAVKGVAGAKLEDLCRRVKQDFAAIQDRVGRGDFERVAAPLMQEAKEIHELLVERLELPEALLEQSAFDQFALSVKEYAAKKIKYEGSERERNILYSSLIVKWLLVLPLSPPVRREIEQSIREDDRILYSRFGVDPGAIPEALQCFFLAGAEANPDDSIVIPMYRVTDRKLQVDRLRGSAGVAMSWEAAKLLVPRSKQAKPAHGGTAEIELLPSEMTPHLRTVAAQLKSLVRTHTTAQANLRSQRDAEIQAETARQSADLEARAKGFNARTDEANAAIARLKDAEHQALAAETKQWEARRARIEASHAPLVHAAQTKKAKATKSLSGVRGAATIEVPAGILISLIGSLGFGFGAAAVILALVGAVVIGKIVRSTVNTRAARAVAVAEAGRRQELAAGQKDTETKKKEIARAFAKKREEDESELAAVTKERQHFQEAGRTKVEALRKQWNEKIDTAAADFQQSARLLKSQLVRTGQVKKLAQQSEFPAFQAARKKGFVQGEKPSSEMNMTANEEAQAMLMLGRR
jgi:hypothetical protein